MSDPIKDLENFNSEGLPVNPLAPSEVRRLGDRMRRRRNAAAVVAGVAAVAVIAAPIALFAGRDDSSAPSPAPPATSTTSTPDVDPTTPPTPEPITALVKEIPEGFPLAAGWPDDSEAESEEMGLKGPNRSLRSLGFTSCGDTLDDTVYVDRLRADWTNVEDYRSRQLTTYADADQAVAAVKALTDFHRECPTENAGEGYTRVTEVQRTEVGGESWAVVTHFEFDGAPAVGLTITQVIRLGRAVLIDTTANEGGAGPDPDGEVEAQLDKMTSATAEPVSRMCVFTEAGCADGTDPIEAPVVDILGPNGFHGLELGMTADEVASTGEATSQLGSQHDGWPEGCRIVRFKVDSQGVDGLISPEHGLEQIIAGSMMSTPQGIRLGSTHDEVLQAFAHLVGDASYLTTPVSDEARYAMAFADGHVSYLALELSASRCQR
jgi:hypothetical protein